jgi:Tfp pilus assembly protein PilO
MNSFFDRLNLRPAERRLVMAAVIVLFLVANWVFVRPHFGDLRRVRQQLAKARTDRETRQTEINRTPLYQRRLAELEGAGESVPSAEIAVNLIRLVQGQANQSGVAILNIETRKGAAARPNDYFEEQAITISVNTGDKELVDFLAKLGAGKTMIRVRDLSLAPDPSHSKLSGRMTLVASYQKPPSTKPALTSAQTKR